MRIFAIAAACLFAGIPAHAQQYGGGGLTLHQSFVPYTTPGWVDGSSFPAPGLLNCIGGLGYGVDDGARLGATGSFCAGNRGKMGFGGLQGGWQDRRAGPYAAALAGVGGGFLRLEHQDDVLRSAFLYLRPTVALGIPIGKIAAVEGSLFGMLPLPVYQRLNDEPVKGTSFPHVGLQVSVLFGDFSARRKHAKLEPPQPQNIHHTKPPPLELEKPAPIPEDERLPPD